MHDGSTVVSIILSSDKTMLAMLRGNQIAELQYLSFGNNFQENVPSFIINGLILIDLLPKCPNRPKPFTNQQA
jgi:hypothetical protein